MESYINLIDKNVDGCGTDIVQLVKIYGEITNGTIARVREALTNYRKSNSDYTSDELFEAAYNCLSRDEYNPELIYSAEIEV